MAARFDRTMLPANIFTCCFLLICIMCNMSWAESAKCFLSKASPGDADTKLLSRISSLYDQTWEVVSDGLSYTVAVCSDVKGHANSSAVVEPRGKGAAVLGRRSDTQLTGGARWVLLTYGSGDALNTTLDSCTARRASLLLACDADDPDHDSKAHALRLLPSSTPCSWQFYLPTHELCPAEGLSGPAVFLVVLLSLLGAYFALGVLYRRVTLNAQGCQQLPHFGFWSKIGGMCADGCNAVCRCDQQREDSWNNITSNFDGHERDDALLRP